jgi:hypothetical protein
MIRNATVFLFASAVATSLLADQATQKFDWTPVSGVQEVHVEATHVVVSQVSFDLGSTLKGTPVRKSSAKAQFRVDNNGYIDAEVGIAIVVFDAEGNVVATGSGGTKWGYLNKGARDYYTATFPYVYRNFDKAKTFSITLETKEKGRDRSRPRPAPTPVP